MKLNEIFGPTNDAADATHRDKIEQAIRDIEADKVPPRPSSTIPSFSDLSARTEKTVGRSLVDKLLARIKRGELNHLDADTLAKMRWGLENEPDWAARKLLQWQDFAKRKSLAAKKLTNRSRLDK